MTSLLTTRTCHFSPCRTYRYELRIIWEPTRKPQMFIALNPSTADEEKDDPTIRRCIDFAQQWGAGGLVMCNIFAFRATDPKVMLATTDPIGPENTIGFLQGLAWGCLNRPIAAWGKNAGKWKRGVRVHEFRDSGPLDCLRLNGDMSPCHPLYLPRDLKPMPFNYTRSA